MGLVENPLQWLYLLTAQINYFQLINKYLIVYSLVWDILHEARCVLFLVYLYINHNNYFMHVDINNTITITL